MRLLLWSLCLLTLIPAVASAEHRVLVKADSLTMRQKPSKKAQELGKLTTFQPVIVLKQDKGWTQVRTIQNQSGWVLSTYLTKNAFVMVEADPTNVRRGPGTEYETIINYGQKNLPLCVLDSASNGWLKVMDFEGDRGWVHPKMVKVQPNFIITKAKKTNVRKVPDAKGELAFQTERGVIMQVLEEKGDWLHIRHQDGDEGWVSIEPVFGWVNVSDPAKAHAAAGEDKSAAGTKKAAKAGKRTAAKKSGEAATDEGAAAAGTKAGTAAKKTAKKTVQGAAKKKSTSKTGRKGAARSAKKKSPPAGEDASQAGDSKTQTAQEKSPAAGEDEAQAPKAKTKTAHKKAHGASPPKKPAESDNMEN